MIELHIEKTGKGYGRNDRWVCFDLERKPFPSLKEAKVWLKETYGKAKRSPLYIDTPEGTKKVGWVIGFRNGDLSHSPVQKWIQQDWITVTEIRPVFLK